MKLLFDHVEKTGGTTVIHYLKSCYDPADSLLLYDEPECKAVNEAFRNAMPSLVAGHHAIYLSHKCPDHKRATVLRDPVERVVSLFRFCKQREYIPVETTVSEFLNSAVASNYYTWRFSGIPPYLIRKCPELAIDRALQSLSLYDHIGFTDDIAGFIATLNLPCNFEPIISNRTEYTEEISDDDLEMIRQYNSLDTQIFNQVSAARPRETNSLLSFA